MTLLVKTDKKRPISPFLEVGFKKIFDSHLQNFIGKFKMIMWN